MFIRIDYSCIGSPIFIKLITDLNNLFYHQLNYRLKLSGQKPTISFVIGLTKTDVLVLGLMYSTLPDLAGIGPNLRASFILSSMISFRPVLKSEL